MRTPQLTENIKRYRKIKGITQEQVADTLGVSRQTIINWEKGVGSPNFKEAATMSHLFDIDVSFLYNGSERDHEIFEKGDAKMRVAKGEVPGPIPFFDAVATAGLSVLHADQSPIVQPSETVNPGTWFRAATAAMRVYGDSMYPKYKSGCIIALKEIIDKEEIIFGEDYVVETNEQRVLKRLMSSAKGEEFIELTSINPQSDNRGKPIYAPKDFHLNKVRRVYKVLGQIQYETGGDTLIHR